MANFDLGVNFVSASVSVEITQALPRPGTTKINLLSLNKLILDSLSAASPASSLPTARNHQNQFVEPQQIDFGIPCPVPPLPFQVDQMLNTKPY